jgi:hypothetical protein
VLLLALTKHVPLLSTTVHVTIRVQHVVVPYLARALAGTGRAVYAAAEACCVLRTPLLLHCLWGSPRVLLIKLATLHVVERLACKQATSTWKHVCSSNCTAAGV